MRRFFTIVRGRRRAVSMPLAAQQGQPGPPGRQGAPGPGGRGGPPADAAARRRRIDITGYWVALVTDDWRYRMLTPPKGNADYLPVNAEARRVMDEWDPAKDEAAGEACRGYGAGGVMRLPGRLHITWENDNAAARWISTPARRRAAFSSAPAPAAPPASRRGRARRAARWQLPGGAGPRARDRPVSWS